MTARAREAAKGKAMMSDEVKTVELEAGRETDVEMLVHVYKFPRRKIFTDEIGCLMFIPSGKPRRTHMIDAQPVPNFSTSITAAWLLVDALKAEGYGVSVDDFPGFAECSVLKKTKDKDDCWIMIAYAKAKTPALAINRAVRQAVTKGEKR
jgi:hypothetical protein